MNFMEKGNTESSSRDNRFYEDDVDQNHHSEIMLMTTSTSTSSGGRQGGGGDMIDPIFSSTKWASSVTPTTTLASSPPSNNLYQQYYTNTRGIEIGTSHTPPSQLDLMDTSPTPSEEVVAVEKEHMFDKVVTPSDVGKLNRLVIPKQHAEKYFPLDSSTNDKGLLLNFEDVTTGKLWRFRYSYWNSSQSYVMTKGWSRFVKEKKLDPGDIVSFHRAKAKLDRLFIDCTHRPLPVPHPQLISSSSLPFSSNIMNYSLHPTRYFPGNSFQNTRYSSPTTMGHWSSSTSNPPPPGLFLPSHAATPLRDGRGSAGGGGDHYFHPASHNHNWRTNGYNNNYYGGSNMINYSPSGNSVMYHNSAPTTVLPYHHHQQEEEEEASSSSRMMRFSSLDSSGEIGISERGVDPQLEQVLLHSVPVVQGKAAAKRLRLFGVNMDCPISNDEYQVEDLTILPSTTIGHHQSTNASPSSLAHLVQLRLNNNSSGPSSPHHHHL